MHLTAAWTLTTQRFCRLLACSWRSIFCAGMRCVCVVRAEACAGGRCLHDGLDRSRPSTPDEWCRATLHHSRRRHARRPGLRSAPGLRWKLAARRQRRQSSPGTIAVTSNGKQPPAHLSLVQPTNDLLVVLGRLHQLLQSPFLLSNTGVPGVYTFIRTAAHRMGGGGVVLTCPSVCACVHMGVPARLAVKLSSLVLPLLFVFLVPCARLNWLTAVV